MSPPPGTSTIDALLSTVQQLWPDASSVELVRRGAPPRPGTIELGVVPDATRARLLVPLGRRATAASLARYSAALSPREVAQRVAVGAATRALGPVMLGDRVRICAPGQDHIGTVVSELVGAPVQLSLGIGTARANRKPVLGAVGPDGRPLAFVKVGERAVSTGHVRAEAEALEVVGARRWHRLEVPRLLGTTQWRDLFVVAMTALQPPAWQGRDGRWPIPDEAIDELCAAFDEGSSALEATPWWSRVSTVPDRLVDDVAARRLTEALERVRHRSGSVQVRVAAWHGDLTPWNLGRVSGGRCMIWDWERFETGVPVGLDRVHYAVNTLSRERGFGVDVVVEGLRRGAPPGGDEPGRQAVVGAYLLAITSRYLIGAQEPGGEVVAARAATMLDVLDAFSRAGALPEEEIPT